MSECVIAFLGSLLSIRSLTHNPLRVGDQLLHCLKEMSPISPKSLLRQASASPLCLMKPARARVFFFPLIFPFSSTSAISICTEAWSKAVIRELVAEHFLGM